MEVERDGVESVIGGPDDGPDGALDVADVGAERTGALLGVRIRRGRRTSACRLVMRISLTRDEDGDRPSRGAASSTRDEDGGSWSSAWI